MQTFVAVIGATGQTGKLIVRKLLGRKISIRVLSRNPAKARRMFGSSVDIVAGDLVGSPNLNELMNGCTHLFTAHGSDNDEGPEGFRTVDYGGIRKALRSIAPERVIHIIVMSTVHAVGQHPPYQETGRPFYWKRRAEVLVQRSRHAHTIVRAGWLTNYPGGVRGIVVTQGTKMESRISRADVAEVMVQSMFHEAARDTTFEIYNNAGSPVADWDKFFSTLRSNPKHSSLG